MADTIVPGAANPLAYNRYAYTYNQPVNFSDPTGHTPICFDQCLDAGDDLTLEENNIPTMGSVLFQEVEELFDNHDIGNVFDEFVEAFGGADEFRHWLGSNYVNIQSVTNALDGILNDYAPPADCVIYPACLADGNEGVQDELEGFFTEVAQIADMISSVSSLFQAATAGIAGASCVTAVFSAGAPPTAATCGASASTIIFLGIIAGGSDIASFGATIVAELIVGDVGYDMTTGERLISLDLMVSFGGDVMLGFLPFGPTLSLAEDGVEFFYGFTRGAYDYTHILPHTEMYQTMPEVIFRVNRFDMLTGIEVRE